MSKPPMAPPRAITYCIVPRSLAPKLHAPLLKHFERDREVVVVVEMRDADQRTGERRSQERKVSDDRRRVRNAGGRRVADRRAIAVPVDVPALPARLRRHASAVRFVERLEPSIEAALDQDTARLVIRSQSGDREAFGEIYMRYFDRVFSYARVVVEDHQEAEDVTQDVFVKAFEALPRYQARAGIPFRGWLFRIARNAAIDRMKRLGKLQVEEPEIIGRRVESIDAPRTDLDLDWVSDRDLILLIERLPQPQRQVLTLRYALGMNAPEIALVMDRTPESVSQLHSRARAFLEERLTAIRAREGRASARSPMLIRLRRMPVLRARRTALTTGPAPASRAAYASTATRARDR